MIYVLYAPPIDFPSTVSISIRHRHQMSIEESFLAGLYSLYCDNVAKKRFVHKNIHIFFLIIKLFEITYIVPRDNTY